MKKSDLIKALYEETDNVLKEFTLDKGDNTMDITDKSSLDKVDMSRYANAIRRNIIEDLHASFEFINENFFCTFAEKRVNEKFRIKFTEKVAREGDNPGLFLLEPKPLNDLLEAASKKVALSDFKENMKDYVEEIVEEITDNEYTDYDLVFDENLGMYAKFFTEEIEPCDFFIRFTKVKTYKNFSQKNFNKLRAVKDEGGAAGAAAVRKYVQEYFIKSKIDEHIKDIRKYLRSLAFAKEDAEAVKANKAAAAELTYQKRVQNLGAKIDRARSNAADYEKIAIQTKGQLSGAGKMRSLSQGVEREAMIRVLALYCYGNGKILQSTENYMNKNPNQRDMFKGLKLADLLSLWNRLLTKEEYKAGQSGSPTLKIGDQKVNLAAIEKHIKNTSSKKEEPDGQQDKSGEDAAGAEQQDKPLEGKALKAFQKARKSLTQRKLLRFKTRSSKNNNINSFPANFQELKDILQVFNRALQSKQPNNESISDLSPIQKYILREQEQGDKAKTNPDAAAAPKAAEQEQALTQEMYKLTVKLQKILFPNNPANHDGVYGPTTHKIALEKLMKLPAYKGLELASSLQDILSASAAANQQAPEPPPQADTDAGPTEQPDPQTDASSAQEIPKKVSDILAMFPKVATSMKPTRLVNKANTLAANEKEGPKVPLPGKDMYRMISALKKNKDKIKKNRGLKDQIIKSHQDQYLIAVKGNDQSNTEPKGSGPDSSPKTETSFDPKKMLLAAQEGEFKNVCAHALNKLKEFNLEIPLNEFFYGTLQGFHTIVHKTSNKISKLGSPTGTGEAVNLGDFCKTNKPPKAQPAAVQLSPDQQEELKALKAAVDQAVKNKEINPLPTTLQSAGISVDLTKFNSYIDALKNNKTPTGTMKLSPRLLKNNISKAYRKKLSKSK